VVFAPTPAPPDLSPVSYTHPSGAFSLLVPRTWSLHEQNTTTLATASFAPPDNDEPALLFTVMNAGEELDSGTFGDLINQYQTQVRPDVDRYTEQNRQAMGDGSWRMTGLRKNAVGVTQQVNTFIDHMGSMVGIAEVVVPEDNAHRRELQSVVNSFTLNPDAPLESAPLTTLTFASSTGLSVLHVSTWATPTGVFFITGEVANYGSSVVTDVPIRAALRTVDGLSVGEADDMVMAYAIPPGGFAPFSLRFGQGQPSLTATYELSLGGNDWQPDPNARIVGPDELTWTDESSATNDGHLIISGTITNISGETVHNARAVVTIFDHEQTVVAAGYNDAAPSELPPGETAQYQVVVPEMGSEPANYIVIAQGRP
jgi:hypothetical protein